VVSQVTDALVDAIRQGTPDLGDWVVRHYLSAAETDPQTSRLVVALIWRVVLSRGRVKRRPRPSPWAPLRLPDGGARGGERVGVDASSV